MTVEAIKNRNPICECGGTNYFHDRVTGDKICVNCGLVSIEKIAWGDQGINFYSQEQIEKKIHTGPPLNYKIPDMGMSTMIDKHNRDIYGQKLTPIEVSKSQNLRKTMKRTRRQDPFSRNLRIAVIELDRIVSQLEMPDKIVKEAVSIYRKILKRKLIRGYSIESVIYACLYAASRIVRLPRTLDEIASQSLIPKKEIYRAFVKLKRYVEVPLPIPEDFVTRFCSELGLPGAVMRRANELIKLSRKAKLSFGKNYVGISIAVIYVGGIIENKKVTQEKLHQISGISEVTIRNRYKELCNGLNINLEVWEILKYLLMVFVIKKYKQG